MKKILYTTLILLFVSAGAVRGQAALLVLIFGEKAASENFFFSLKAGVNYSMITNVEDGKHRIGFNFGLVNNIRLNDKWFLTPEFLALSPRGVSDIPILSTGNPDLDDLLQDTESTDRKLNYIDIPVLLKYHINEKWSISAGPQFSILTGAKDIYHSSPINGVSLKADLDVQDAFNAVDFAAVIDLTYVISEPKGGIGVNVYIRYGVGLMDIVKENTGDPFRNNTLQIGASFPFIEVPD